jgi:trehalose 6-phosphate phosphatase
VKDLLLARHRPVLERLARQRSLLAFDYDGVLAPLVTDLGGAPMRRRTRRLLELLVREWPCAVVSGRSWRRTRALTEGVVPIVVGNHGFELGRPRPVPRATLQRTRRWRAALERGLADVPGVAFEDKRSTLAVHFGLARRWRAAGRIVDREAGLLRGARLVGGKKVLNVIPAGFPDKGDAVRALLRRERLETALFVGDDVTDEDAFAVGPPLVLGVRVGAGPSRAHWRLTSQERVDDLLEVLVSLRAPASGRRTGGRRGRGERPASRRGRNE